MSTDLSDREALEAEAGDPDEREFVERLRASGARVGNWSLDRPRAVVKQRPWWLAFTLRNLRRLHLIRD